jgi:hypothetical protein
MARPGPIPATRIPEQIRQVVTGRDMKLVDPGIAFGLFAQLRA